MMKLKIINKIELTVDNKSWFILMMALITGLAGYKFKLDHDEAMALINLDKELLKKENEEGNYERIR